MQKKKKKEICAVYEEAAVTDWTCQKWCVKLLLEISCWMVLHSRVDQMTWMVIK